MKGGPSFERIGKSLLRYFKPVRSVAAHEQNAPLPQQNIIVHKPELATPDAFSKEQTGQEKKRGLKLLKFKKDPVAQPEEPQDLITKTSNIPEKAPAEWLGMVVYLLQSCRRLTARMGKGLGLRMYKRAADDRSKQSIKSVGSIIDTNTDSYFDRPRKIKMGR